MTGLILVFLGKYHSRPVNRSAAVAGLPLDEGRLTPRLFLQAAKRHGLSARIVKAKLKDLKDRHLPGVLVQKSGNCLVITGITDGKIEVVDGASDAVDLVSIDQRHALLVESLTGFETVVVILEGAIE